MVIAEVISAATVGNARGQLPAFTNLINSPVETYGEIRLRPDSLPVFRSANRES
jgi:hypothetical protein